MPRINTLFCFELNQNIFVGKTKANFDENKGFFLIIFGG